MKWYRLSRKFSREDAESILKYMQEIIDKYGFVTLGDFYDLIGYCLIEDTDDKKIWRSLTGARVSLMKRPGYYSIKLPDFTEIL